MRAILVLAVVLVANFPVSAAEYITETRARAAAGDASAQFELGLIHEKGTGVTKSSAEAVKWYRKAAEQGHVAAQLNLGVAYATGDGVNKDSAEAVKWFRKAAERGHPIAQISLGYAYNNGDGVAKDAAEAVKWFRKAADVGHVIGQLNLGSMYATGTGVKKDLIQAHVLFAAASAKGNETAKRNLVAIEAEMTEQQKLEARAVAGGLGSKSGSGTAAAGGVGSGPSPSGRRAGTSAGPAPSSDSDTISYFSKSDAQFLKANLPDLEAKLTPLIEKYRREHQATQESSLPVSMVLVKLYRQSLSQDPQGAMPELELAVARMRRMKEEGTSEQHTTPAVATHEADANQVLFTIAKLSARIDQLEQRLNALEPSSSQPVQSLPPDLRRWRQLQVGMSKQEVRELLGEPIKAHSDRWEYSNEEHKRAVLFLSERVFKWYE